MLTSTHRTDESLSAEAAAREVPGLTVRGIRRRPSLAVGGEDPTPVVKALLPLVHSVLAEFLPGAGASAEIAGPPAASVFEGLGRAWRRLPRRTVVACWLLRSAWYAARHERRRLGLGTPPRASAAGVAESCLRAFFRLRTAEQNVLLLHDTLGLSLAETARVLACKEARVAAVRERGLTRLAALVRRSVPGVDASRFLAGLAKAPPPEVADLVMGRLAAWAPGGRPDERVVAIKGAWRRAAWGRRCWRFGMAAATGFSLLLVTIAVTVWLARSGHLMSWFIRHSSRQVAREVPGVAAPARPWPGVGEGPASGGGPLPRTAAELYCATNVWAVRLSFTPDQWRAIEPSRVPPSPSMMGADGNMDLRNPRARRSGLAGVVGLEFNWVRARLDFAGRSLSPVAVRYRGNGTYLNSLFGPKQSLKVDLDKYAKGQSLGGVHTLNFVNAIPDSSYLHDTLAQELFRALGVPGPRTGYAYVTVHVPGRGGPQPLGLYVLIENVDADFAADRFGARDVPIFKPVTTELFKYLGDDGEAYAGIYDLKTRATPRQWDRVIAFARLVTKADDDEFARCVGDYLALEDFAGFLAGHVLLSSYDGFLSNGQNFYLYLDPATERFGFVPWDQDHSWGEFGYVGTVERRERASIWRPSTYANRFLDRVLKVEAFRAAYRRRLEQALAGPFTPEHLCARIDQLAAVIRPAVAAESEFRLRRFDEAIAANWSDAPRTGPPEGPRAAVHQLKRFIVRRAESVRDQLAGRADGEVLAPIGRQNEQN